MSQTATVAREPLLRIAKREGTTMPQKIAAVSYTHLQRKPAVP